MPPRTRTAAPKNAKGAEKRLADLEAENKRLNEQLATKRAACDDDDDADKDERDTDDTATDKDDEKDSDDQRDGGGDDDDDKKGDDEKDSDDQRDDDADDEMDADDADDKRAGKGKREPMTAAEVRKAAEKAVRADRVRASSIREIAAQFGFPKLGERHAAAETSVRAFKDLVLERLADRQKKRGNTTFAAGATAEVGDARSADAGTRQSRDFEKGAAEARALLGKK